MTGRDWSLHLGGSPPVATGVRVSVFVGVVALTHQVGAALLSAC